ncbi:iron chelate uptake ABC transporter family permease subunit [Celerinatantimonas yamalensis]|uniref:iron chelate uptake ABC transporter family permease subunit n=1 Tax=Celerinatantimonas yamalensis TaxID=559956 RepID=UPI0038CC1998
MLPIATAIAITRVAFILIITLGPIAFIGLVSPHMATLLGARKSLTQMLLAALCGMTLMLWADWLGQIWLYPKQIAAGTLVAVMGSIYFLSLLLLNRYQQMQGKRPRS